MILQLTMQRTVLDIKNNITYIIFKKMNVIPLCTIPPVESADVQAIYLALPWVICYLQTASPSHCYVIQSESKIELDSDKWSSFLSASTTMCASPGNNWLQQDLKNKHEFLVSKWQVQETRTRAKKESYQNSELIITKSSGPTGPKLVLQPARYDTKSQTRGLEFWMHVGLINSMLP
jgi:hypothetical protein